LIFVSQLKGGFEMEEEKIFKSKEGREYQLCRIYPNFIIVNAIRELAKKINERSKVETITLVIIMNGAIPFGHSLAMFLSDYGINVKIEMVSVSSYNGTKSEEIIFNSFKFRKSLNNENVVIVDDIVDTGKTLKAVKEKMLFLFPNILLETAVLLNKPNRLVIFEPDYSCLPVEADDFVVGFGPDFDGNHRNFLEIFKIKFLK
jgi:hypoxanthine phosphoribosyltransferase